MKRSLFKLLLALIIVVSLFGFARNDGTFETLLANLDKLRNDYPQEKIHLQTDKPYYSVGEDVWFKAYVVNAERNLLSNQSKILYVDLLDDRDSVRQTLLLPVENGLASGNLHLNDSLLTAGNYHIYAYTKWMQNFGSEYFFKKDITLVNALHDAVSGTIETKFNETEQGRQLNAQITYTDNGGPYANQPVTYALQAGGKTLASGKTLTDLNGRLILSNIIKNEYKTTPLVVTTALIKPGYRSITQNFAIHPLATVADVQFFPEGGHFVSGIRTKIGFKAVKPDGLGENISGYIIEEGSSEHVAEFKSEHAGMGVFGLQPIQGKSYIAVIKHEDGSEKRYTLPKADASGYVLNVNHVGKDSLSVRISASPNLTNGREAALVAQCNGRVQFAAKIKLEKGSNVSYISAKKFQTGISQFTLFTPDMAPIAERLVFIDHNDGLTAGIKTDKAGYNKRDKVNLDLTVTDANGDPAIGSFSVAVTDEGKVKQNEDDETSILSNLLLTSDIKGYIEQPNYYFNPQNLNRSKYLDELLLTQGWRRFSWADLQNNKFPELKYPHEQSLTVSGNITTMSNKPVPKGKVTLFAKTGGLPIIIDTVADENGHYVFDNLNFPDSAKIVVRAANAKNNATFNIKITIDQKPHLTYAAAHDAYTVTNAGLADYLRSTQSEFDELDKFGLFKSAIALKEVKIQAKTNYYEEHTIPHSANLSPGMADIVIKPDKLQQYSNLLYAFYNLPGIEIKNNNIYLIRTQHSLRGGPKPMLVLLDGTPVDGAMILQLSPYDIAGVEILTTGGNTTVYGSDGSHGVIIITTKRGDEATPIDNSFNKAHYTPQGYSATKQFYSPQYDAPAKNQMADLRSTIYWNPDIITDAQGHATFSYFNADGMGNYKVTLEGMDTNGGLVRKTFTYVVK